MENKRIIAIVMDYEYRNVRVNAHAIKAEPGLFIVDGSEWFKAKNVWQVTVQDESGKETHIWATNYADANGPYHWPEGLPWTPIS